MGFPGGSVLKNLPADAGFSSVQFSRSVVSDSLRPVGSIPGSGRSPGEGNGNPLQYSFLGNPMDRRTWQATVCGIRKVGHDLVTEQQQRKLKLFYLQVAFHKHIQLTLTCGLRSNHFREASSDCFWVIFYLYMFIVLHFIPFFPPSQLKHLFISFISGLITVFHPFRQRVHESKGPVLLCYHHIPSVCYSSWHLVDIYKQLLNELKSGHSFLFLLNFSETHVRYVIFHCTNFQETKGMCVHTHLLEVTNLEMLVFDMLSL